MQSYCGPGKQQLYYCLPFFHECVIVLMNVSDIAGTEHVPCMCLLSVQVLTDAGAPHIQIICKIESQAGLVNFDSILQVADGIMVARGDLAMEVREAGGH